MQCAVCRTDIYFVSDIKVSVNFMSDMWLKLFCVLAELDGSSREQVVVITITSSRYFIFISNTGPESGIRISGSCRTIRVVVASPVWSLTFKLNIKWEVSLVPSVVALRCDM